MSLACDELRVSPAEGRQGRGEEKERLGHLFSSKLTLSRFFVWVEIRLYKKMEIFVSLLLSTTDVLEEKFQQADLSSPSTFACLQRAKPATKREMSQFHSDEYVEFLARITPENMQMFGREQGKCEWARFSSF